VPSEPFPPSPSAPNKNTVSQFYDLKKGRLNMKYKTPADGSLTPIIKQLNIKQLNKT
jgi:hypothetical protein